MKISLFFVAVSQAKPSMMTVYDPTRKAAICGGEITRNGIITSPGFNKAHYYNNLDCTWEINMPDVSNIVIFPEVFQIEPSWKMDWDRENRYVDCRFDSLKIKWKEHNELKNEKNSKSKKFAYEFCSVDMTLREWENGPSTTTPITTTTTTRARNFRKYWLAETTTTTATTTTSPIPTTTATTTTTTTATTTTTVTTTAISSYYLGSERTYLGDFSAPLRIKGNKATIKFRTDSTFSGMLGFKLRIEGGPNQIQLRSGAVSSPDEDEICGGEITTDGILMSSSKNVFSSIFDCTWTINIPDVSSIMIYPEVLEIEPHSIDWFGMEQDCRWNYLKIDWNEKDKFRKENQSKAKHFSYEFCSIEKWGSNPYNWVNPTTTTTKTITSTISKNRKTGFPHEILGRVQTYVGDFSEPLKIKGGKATIKYRYDAWLNGPDFMFIKSRFKLRIEGKSCNQVQTGSGAVTSPGWPENYNNNDKCKYTLNAEPGKLIKITFDEFDVETSAKCKYDSLTIMGRKYCGNSGRKSPKETVTIYAESTELLWSSDKMITSKGFSFSWESVDNPVQLQSGALESAVGFNSHMDLFVMQLYDQMVLREWNLRRPKRFEALSQIWDNVKIAEQQFQTGDCYTDFGYKTFDFKVFDGSQSICINLDSFKSNAGIFFGNFVCNPKEDFLNSPTFYKWQKMVNEIDTICDPFSGPKR